MSIVRYRQWPAPRVPQDEIRQVFDRFIDGAAAANDAAANDRSAEAAPQWVPRVDVREEVNRFVIQADLPDPHGQGHRVHQG